MSDAEPQLAPRRFLALILFASHFLGSKAIYPAAPVDAQLVASQILAPLLFGFRFRTVGHQQVQNPSLQSSQRPFSRGLLRSPIVDMLRLDIEPSNLFACSLDHASLTANYRQTRRRLRQR